MTNVIGIGEREIDSRYEPGTSYVHGMVDDRIILGVYCRVSAVLLAVLLAGGRPSLVQMSTCGAIVTQADPQY